MKIGLEYCGNSDTQEEEEKMEIAYSVLVVLTKKTQFGNHNKMLSFFPFCHLREK